MAGLANGVFLSLARPSADANFVHETNVLQYTVASGCVRKRPDEAQYDNRRALRLLNFWRPNQCNGDCECVEREIKLMDSQPDIPSQLECWAESPKTYERQETVG